MNGKKILLTSLSVLVLIFFYSFYSHRSSPYPVALPLNRDAFDLFFIEIEVNKEKQMALLDLGSPFVRIDHASIEKGLVLPTGEKRKRNNLLEPSSEEEIFSLSDLHVGPLHLKDILCMPSYLTKAIYFDEGGGDADIQTDDVTVSIIGRLVFESHIIVLDFRNQKLWVCENREQLSKTPFVTFSALDVGAKFLPEGIQVPLQYGEKKLFLVLDTGSSYNLILDDSGVTKPGQAVHFDAVKENPSLLATELPVGSFYTVNIPKTEKCDGLIGVPFFEEHVVLIDFPGQSVSLLTPN